MINENEIPEQNQEEVQAAEPEKRLFSEKEVQEAIAQRAKRERQASEKREAEFRAKIAELESRVNAGSATQNEQMQVMNARQTEGQARQQGYTHEQAIAMAEQHLKQTTLQQKIQDAIEKDAEFKTLSTTGNPIPPEAQMAMSHLDNVPAVLKHLLKDKKDYQLMNAYVQQRDLPGFTRFVNDLSDKLESTAVRPKPSPYEPIPDLSDSGDSDQDWEGMVEYVRNKY